jgi:hypothetical protein
VVAVGADARHATSPPRRAAHSTDYCPSSGPALASTWLFDSGKSNAPEGVIAWPVSSAIAAAWRASTGSTPKAR